MQHVISVGGGFTSTLYTPERVIATHGKENVTLLMARLPNEDPDVWRLCAAVEQEFGVPITYIGKDLTPWDIFHKVGMIGNTRIDPCSKQLKRDVLKAYLKKHFDPADTTLHVGITWDEQHRMSSIVGGWGKLGYRVEAPLLENFYLSRDEQMADCERRFGFVPRLYRYGFSHNNCGGACVKAGMKEWARLYYYLPDVYAWWEENETLFRDTKGKNVAILRDRSGGKVRPLPLKDFRQRLISAWAGYPPTTPFEELPTVRSMTATLACVYCAAM